MLNRIPTIILIITIIISQGFFVLPVFAVNSSSNNYNIYGQINPVVGYGSSANYSVEVGGQTPAGIVSSSNYIDSNEYLLYLSAYVNKNYFIHGYGDGDWKYSSLLDYLGKRNGKLCSKNIILNQFDSIKEYEKFLNENALFLKEKKEFQKYLLE